MSRIGDLIKEAILSRLTEGKVVGMGRFPKDEVTVKDDSGNTRKMHRKDLSDMEDVFSGKKTAYEVNSHDLSKLADITKSDHVRKLADDLDDIQKTIKSEGVPSEKTRSRMKELFDKIHSDGEHSIHNVCRKTFSDADI